MFKYIMEGHYRGFVAHDKLTASATPGTLFCDTVVVPLHHSFYLVFRHRLPELGACLSLVAPNDAPYRVLSSEYVNEPVPNMVACRLAERHLSTIMFTYFSKHSFDLNYPNFPTDFRMQIRGVIRVSFNGQSHFFDLTDRDCEKLRYAFGFKPRQQWEPLFCRNYQLTPSQTEMTMPFWWTVVLGQRYF